MPLEADLGLPRPDLPDREAAGAGSVIDQAELDSSHLWESSATAAEPSDLVVFRGRLLEHLRRDLRVLQRT